MSNTFIISAALFIEGKKKLYVGKGNAFYWTPDISKAKRFSKVTTAMRHMRCNRMTYGVMFYDIYTLPSGCRAAYERV